MDQPDPVICTKCGAGVAIRVNRNGFLQCSVANRFGYYPWKCGACGAVFLFRRRGLRVRRLEIPHAAVNRRSQSRQT